MFLETFATLNSMYDTSRKPRPPKDDDVLDGVADGLRRIKKEIDRRQAEAAMPKRRPKPFPEHREHIHTGALQDELFRRRRDEMIDQAAFHARYMEAMNELHDIASRKR